MGLQCSILGHAFEPAGVERDREEQGSEVVTTEREIQRCTRCGTERVVSESTEVTAVVDATDVEIEADEAGDGPEIDPESEGGITGAVQRSDAIDDRGRDEMEDGERDAMDDRRGVEHDVPSDIPGARSADGIIDTDDGADAPDPDEEDAEILTDDDEPERRPGEWPDEPAPSSSEGEDAPDLNGSGDTEDSDVSAADDEDDEADGTDPMADSLSGITVPEGEIACPACSFRVEADSGYRGGDPCPECNAWLEAERNQ